jgi:hypothetical protein
MDLKLAKVLNFIEQAGTEGGAIPPQYLKEAADDLVKVLHKQFNKTYDDSFRLRMSNIGKPLCQLQMAKAGHQKAEITAQQRMNFIIGDLMEVVLKAVLKSADVGFEDGKDMQLLVNGEVLKGENDCLTDGEVDDIKSASGWSFDNKFDSFASLVSGDSFGYIGQLVGYSEGMKVPLGGWWVWNKQDGRITYLRFDEAIQNKEAILADFRMKEEALRTNAPFKRCFDDEEDTFYKKKTGHRKLPTMGTCSWCEYRFKCWPTLQEIPSLSSKAKNKPIVAYTFIDKGDRDDVC